MFHSIPPGILERMRDLETRDKTDRADGTPHMRRLRQIPPEAGKFLALLLANAPQGQIIEVGTSAGYSTLWLALAAQAASRRVTTFEILPEKAELARETFRLAGVEQTVDLIAADARTHIEKFEEIAFCFLDAEKEIYGKIYDMVVPRLTQGGLLVADNAISHCEALHPMLERALGDVRLDALIVPIGKGELVCRKIRPAERLHAIQTN
ncbi:MAG: hypothetical protein HFACDABA_00750 [Anaerolineales bacterium]|nr:hypothetical protein [Anaerolineales bacterium]